VRAFTSLKLEFAPKSTKLSLSLSLSLSLCWKTNENEGLGFHKKNPKFGRKGGTFEELRLPN
jgi:hypothetical protein